MTVERRRGHRRFLHAFSTTIADVPVALSRLFARKPTTDARRKKRPWTRPRRIAAALAVVFVALAGGATAYVALRVRDPAQTARRLHAEAFDQYAAKRYDEALVTWRKILAINPSDKNARFDEGAALLKLGRTEEALRSIRAAAELDPDFDDAHFALAQDAELRGDDDAALAELRLVVKSPPTSGAARSMIAALLLRRGLVVEAMPHLEAAVADGTTPALARVRDATTLGRLHGVRALVSRDAARERRLESDCYAAATRAADEEIARAARDPSAPVAALHAARAEALLAADPSHAREALVDADLAFGAAVDPADRAEVRLLRAQIYGTLGDAAAADTELAAAVAGDVKPSAAGFRTVAGMYAARGALDRAVKILDLGAAAHPEDVALGLDRANALFASGGAERLAAAETECRRLAAADKRGTAALLLLGDVRRAQDDVAGARKAYEEAMARDANDARARLRVAGTFIAEYGAKSADADARLADAERIARDVLAATPDSPDALLALAKAKLCKSPGRDPPGGADPGNAEARNLLMRAVAGDPSSVEARTFLCYARWLVREDEQAAVELRQILTTYRDGRPWLHALLANCLFEARSYAAAADEAAVAVAGLPNEAEAWAIRAAATREAGNDEGALEAYRRLDALRPKDLSHLFHQAAVLGKMGRFAAAEERFAAADERVRAIADDDERGAAEVRVAEARSDFYRVRGDVERARGALGAVVDKNPSKAGPYVAYARFLLSIQQTDEAERQVERGLAVDPSSVEARRLRCEIEFGRRKVTPVLLAQIQAVERAATQNADAARTSDYLRGKLAALQGDLRVAKELLGRYAAAAPTDVDGQYALGAALAAAGEYAESVTRLENAARLAPGSAEVRVTLAKTRQAWATDMMRRGRFVEAQATLRRATTDDPESREARALLAESLRFTGEVELSEKEIRALLRADPTDRAALRMLGAIQVQQGRLDAAAATLADLVKAAPEDWAAWRFYSAVLADKGDLDGAENAARAGHNAAPDEPGALAALLYVLVLRGDAAAAEKEIASATERRPDEPQYPYFLAMLRMQQGRFEDAVAAAGKALDLRPAMPGALQVAIAALSTGLHDTERAAEFARARAAKAKDDAVTACLLAQIESDLGRRDAALAALEPTCAGDSPPPYATSLQGLLLLDAGEFEKARAALKKGIAAFAESPDLHYLLSQAWLADPSNVKDGEPQAPARDFAVNELRAVLATMKAHAPALNNLAWLLSKDEATRAEALQCAEAAVQLRPDHAPYLDTWATVLSRVGRKDQAVAALRRALGACETERGRLEQLATKKGSTAETLSLDASRRRLERVTTEVKAHYEDAIRASTSK